MEVFFEHNFFTQGVYANKIDGLKGLFLFGSDNCTVLKRLDYQEE